MSTLAFDSLRYARRLREAGVPEPQADVQAELMAEAFGFYAANILTKDHFESVLDAKLDARFAQQDAKLEMRLAEQDAKLEKRLAEQDAKFLACFAEQDAKFLGCFADQNNRFEGRFSALEKTQSLHTWILGIIVVALVVPQLRSLLA